MSWYNPTSWFIDKANVDAGADADAKLRALNQQDYAPGGRLYNAAVASSGEDQAQANLQTVLDNAQTDATLNYSDATASVNDAFVQGWNDAYSERAGQAKVVLNAPFKVLWDSLPWYFWLLGGLALFLYLGGGPVLRKYVGKL